MILMSKEIRINVRTTAQIKRDLEITAELRGLTPSALVNSLVVKAIREEKEREPKAFNFKNPADEFTKFNSVAAAEANDREVEESEKLKGADVNKFKKPKVA